MSHDDHAAPERPACASAVPDPSGPSLFRRLSGLTPARLRLEARPGPTRLSDLMAFQQDHAAARDAIHGQVDWGALARDLAPLPVLHAASRATDRPTYLRRPDLGRQLGEADLPHSAPPLLVVIGDGLSAPAVMAQAAPLMASLAARLPELQDQPVVLAQGARVALGDAIGAAMGAQMVLMLIGERPGLSVADSLGAYLTLSPRVGLRDSARNCVSNIHARGGLSHADAADRLAWLVAEARRMGATGVALKDESGQESLTNL